MAGFVAGLNPERFPSPSYCRLIRLCIPCFSSIGEMKPYFASTGCHLECFGERRLRSTSRVPVATSRCDQKAGRFVQQLLGNGKIREEFRKRWKAYGGRPGETSLDGTILRIAESFG
jgi:hypothetical protein